MKKWKALFSVLTLVMALAASFTAEAAIDTGKLPLKTYVAKRVYCGNSPGSTSNSYWIDAERDLVTIQRYQGDWAYGTYPNSKGKPVTRWFRMSDVLPNIGFANYETSMKGRQTVYRNPNSSNTIGTVFNNEKVVVVGEANGRTQIIYRLSNGQGYKMGWVPDSSINKQNNSSSSNNNTSGRVVPSSTINSNPVINNYLNSNDNNVTPPQNSNYASWKGIATVRATAYLNSGLSRTQRIEWVGKGDAVTVYGEEGNAYFVEYPLSKGGTKHRWVRKNIITRASFAETASNTISNNNASLNANIASSGYNYPMGSKHKFFNADSSNKNKNHDHTTKCCDNGKEGVPVYAITSGTVYYVQIIGDFDDKTQTTVSYGNVAYLIGDDGMSAVYAHLSEFNGFSMKYKSENNKGSTYTKCRNRQNYAIGNRRVSAGEMIGKIGNIGNSSGAHLHFELWKNLSINAQKNAKITTKATRLEPNDYFYY
ncbi:MAG: M23 family metallopeptidase [Phascolarctobacterium sp.]|uniref:M23 family metallopeptidase n=1 Tax=Phascolarctobacterium sp. TaxID=2049039 RepID=UPI0026DAED45|nr:M23 family metallopeptidase [Phascolarctobacterium sp.]MDO4921339.1 M23 family metallopeptidase [Phascolarctobacterium sp.]